MLLHISRLSGRAKRRNIDSIYLSWTRDDR